MESGKCTDIRRIPETQPSSVLWSKCGSLWGTARRAPPRRAATVGDFGDLGARRAASARRDSRSARRGPPTARRMAHVGAPNLDRGAPSRPIAAQFPKFTPEVPQEHPQKGSSFPNSTPPVPQILPPRSPYPHRKVAL